MDKRLQLHDILVSHGYDISWSAMNNPQYEKYLDDIENLKLETGWAQRHFNEGASGGEKKGKSGIKT